MEQQNFSSYENNAYNNYTSQQSVNAWGSGPRDPNNGQFAQNFNEDLVDNVSDVESALTRAEGQPQQPMVVVERSNLSLALCNICNIFSFALALGSLTWIAVIHGLSVSNVLTTDYYNVIGSNVVLTDSDGNEYLRNNYTFWIDYNTLQNWFPEHSESQILDKGALLNLNKASDEVTHLTCYDGVKVDIGSTPLEPFYLQVTERYDKLNASKHADLSVNKTWILVAYVVELLCFLAALVLKEVFVYFDFVKKRTRASARAGQSPMVVAGVNDMHAGAGKYVKVSAGGMASVQNEGAVGRNGPNEAEAEGGDNCKTWMKKRMIRFVRNSSMFVVPASLCVAVLLIFLLRFDNHTMFLDLTAFKYISGFEFDYAFATIVFFVYFFTFALMLAGCVLRVLVCVPCCKQQCCKLPKQVVVIWVLVVLTSVGVGILVVVGSRYSYLTVLLQWGLWALSEVVASLVICTKR